MSAPSRRHHQDHPTWSRASGVVFGILLIAIGAVLLAVNTFGMVLPFELGRVGWPVFVIAPGVVLLVAGLLTDNDAGIGLSVAGGMVTMVGAILAYQSATDHWSSWAYAWALIAPTAVGAAMLLWGIFHGRMGVVRQGVSGLGLGLVLFLVGFGFFEGVLNIGGERGLAGLGRQALPVALILVGVLLVISRLMPSREPRRVASDWAPAGGPNAYGIQPPAATPTPPGPQGHGPLPPTPAPWDRPAPPPAPAQHE
ncbi:MAG TPA: DUF5668 domain-containing protein [Candidatus Limnocylindrales bacterium]|nr:DUF5668 domain-containing protein [Candidatus Limnocylindrales bacterium]